MRTPRSISSTIIAVALLTAPAAAAPAPEGGSVPAFQPGVRLGDTTLELSLPTGVPAGTAMLVTIVGPQGESVLHEELVPWFFTWEPDLTAAEGIYRYEVRPTPPGRGDAPAAGPPLRFRAGSFRWHGARLSDDGLPSSASLAATDTKVAASQATSPRQGPSQLSGLTVSDAIPRIVFDDTDSGGADFSMVGNADTSFAISYGAAELLSLRNPAPGVDQQNSLTVGTTGNVALANFTLFAGGGAVGVGTTMPQKQLHVSDPAGSAATVRLQANGGNDEFAELRAFSDGEFQIATGALGVAQPALRIFPDAPDNALVLQNGKVALLTVDPQATLHVAGDARFEGDVALGSSRTLKTSFASVRPAEVLAGIAELPIASWRYKTEDESTRHIGPFAEDFQRLFGLGDGKTISVIDAQGVILAAIQGMRQELTDREARIVRLTLRLAALEERLGDLRRRR